MKNAFLILGATPDDSAERLRELYEEKQLFSDDEQEIGYAYSELTNLKKRIKHEIRFFTADTFDGFNNIFLNNVGKQSLVMKDMFEQIIKVGKWFDTGIEDLFTKINASRRTAKFASVAHNELVQEATNELKAECVLGVKNLVSNLKEASLVSFFNGLVEQEDYSSFFVDDILAIYEEIIKESVEKKEKLCLQKFNAIEKEASIFLEKESFSFIAHGHYFSSKFSSQKDEFNKAISSWDKMVQPLQVNSRNRGGEHDQSIKFAISIRNKMIDMSNKTQERLAELIESRIYKQAVVDDIIWARNFTDYLIDILGILNTIFEELDIYTEKLKEDKKHLASLKDQLSKILNQIDPNYSYRNSNQQTANNIARQSQTHNTNKTNSWGSGNTPVIQSKKGSIIAAIVIIVFFIIMIAAISSSGSSDSSVSRYTITFDKQGGYGGTSSVEATSGYYLPSATKPSKYGYEFLGYYSSPNGNGTQYYDENMKTVTTWYGYTAQTLYAYWVKEGYVKLTKSNFKDYFTISSNCHVEGQSTVTYSYAIAPSFNYNNKYADNPDSISLKIYVSLSYSSSGYPAGSIYVDITLYKSNGYQASGTKSTTSAIAGYWGDEISSVNGIIYV